MESPEAFERKEAIVQVASNSVNISVFLPLVFQVFLSFSMKLVWGTLNML